MFAWWKRRSKPAQRASSKSAAKDTRYRPELEGLESRELPAVNFNVLTGAVNVSQATGNQREQSIAVNPLNPNQVVAFSNIEDLDGNLQADSGLFFARSTDGGKTWDASYLFTDTTQLSEACCDPQAAWDTFGNVWMTYLTANGDVALAHSTNAGNSFTVTLLTNDGNNDQPSLAVGPGSQPGTGSVWVTYFSSTILPQQMVQGALVTGRGAWSFFGGVRTVPGSALVGGQFGDISVGPRGELAIVYQSFFGPGAGPATIHVNIDPDGLGPKPMGPRMFVGVTNVGAARLIPGTSNNLGIDAEVNLAWDRSNGPHRGRLYLVYTDAADTVTNDTDVFVRFTDNRAKSWSAPVLVSNTTVGSQFNPAIAVDPYTGLVAVAWYDTRNNAAGNSAEFFATASDNGGRSFGREIVVSPGPSTPALSETPPVVGVRPLGFGDYNKIDFVRGLLQLVWADNSPQLVGNPNPLRMDIAAARLRVVSSRVNTRRIQVIYRNDFKLLSRGAALYDGTITIVNKSNRKLLGPVRLEIKLPHRTMQLRSQDAIRVGDNWLITINRNLPPDTPVSFKVRIFNPFRLRIEGLSTTGFATSLR
jgi:hypothetical protein